MNEIVISSHWRLIFPRSNARRTNQVKHIKEAQRVEWQKEFNAWFNHPIMHSNIDCANVFKRAYA